MLSNYPIFTGVLEQIDPSKKVVINTINQYSYCIAEQDPEFKKLLESSDVLLPDGVGITFAYKLFTGRAIKKIAGADLHRFYLEKLNRERGSCFYLGSSATTLQSIQDHLAKDYPSIRSGTYSPPYKPVFTDEDNREMISVVNEFKPDVLFVGMTAPKQEKWAYAQKEKLNASKICSIGAVFDFYAGTVKRPGKIWISLGLEWFIRLLKEPKRMWRRYLYYGPVFLFLVFKEKVKQVVGRRRKIAA